MNSTPSSTKCLILFFNIFIFSGCAGPNPNIGERTADRAYLRHDFDKQAVKWYKRVAVQKAEGDWAVGQSIGAFGKSGYYNQNSDARIAQAWLADSYLNGPEGVPKDLLEAYFNIRTVMEETKGNHIFFCCEFAGGRWITAEYIEGIYNQVIEEMSPEQLEEAKRLYPNWKPTAD